MTPERTWKDVVADALNQLGGEGHLNEISAIAQQDPKAKTNRRVTEKVRQVVRAYKIFEPVTDGSGFYRLVNMPAANDGVPAAPTTSDVTDEIQGKLLYIGQVNDFETFAPADDCTKRQFAGKPLSHLVSLRDIADIPRLHDKERRTIARIDVLWFAERDEELCPCAAFEIENSTGVVTGMQRLNEIHPIFRSRLFIVGEDESKRKKYDELTASASYKKRAADFHFCYFDEVRSLYNAAEQYAAARKEQERLLQAWGL